MQTHILVNRRILIYAVCAAILLIFVPLLSSHVQANAIQHQSPGKMNPLTVDTTVRCSGGLYGGTWYNDNTNDTGHCIATDYLVETPTSAYAVYHMGTVTSVATYTLSVYIPIDGDVTENYDPYQGNTKLATCAIAPFSKPAYTYQSVCTFSTNGLALGQQLSIKQWTGTRSGGVMVNAAIQL